jgi:hypothetical protein
MGSSKGEAVSESAARTAAPSKYGPSENDAVLAATHFAAGQLALMIAEAVPGKREGKTG